MKRFSPESCGLGKAMLLLSEVQESEMLSLNIKFAFLMLISVV